MNTDKIYYTDGHDVVVTESTLKVHNKEYRLPGITKHGISTLRPSRAPGLFLFVMGMLIVAIGAYELVPSDLVRNVYMMNTVITVNHWTIALGAILALTGLLSASFVKPRYAVRISTAEGENDVVVSKHREYIRQIIEGLNQAFIAAGLRDEPVYRGV
jgi:hypothetical protein